METATSDQQLVERMRAGEEGAYQTLLNRFERPIYRFFYHQRLQGAGATGHVAAIRRTTAAARNSHDPPHPHQLREELRPPGPKAARGRAFR